MVSYKPNFRTHVLCAILAVASPCSLLAQAPAPSSGPVNPQKMEQLFNEAAAAFDKKDYDAAAAKLDELVKAIEATYKPVPPNLAGTVELVRFNLGLAYLQAGKSEEAEKALTACVTQFPRGEYASRCYLGIGRARMNQGKKAEAVEALKLAAIDPKLRSEAGLSLAEAYNELKKPDEALKVFRSIMGSDIRTGQQTTAAVSVVKLLAESEKLDDLVAYLDRLIRQPGVRDSMAWYANEVVVAGDDIASRNYDAALIIYRSVPPRDQIIAVQKAALESMRKDAKTLETRVAAEQKANANALGNRSSLPEQLANLKSTIETTEKALTAIEGLTGLDAGMLMRRGRCLYYLERYEEALLCFRTLRSKYASSTETEGAAYAEIAILHKLQKSDGILKLAMEFIEKYPKSDKSEQVSSLVIESLMKSGKFTELNTFIEQTLKNHPDAEGRDRILFYQGVARASDGDFVGAIEVFKKLLQDFPASELAGDARYRLAMSYFLTNNYKETLAACRDYLTRYPDGPYAGDVLYRLAFIDFNDREEDHSDKIIKDLTAFLEKRPNDLAAGSMLCLIGDVYSQKKKDGTDKAIEAYKAAVWKEGTANEVLQYALETATSLMQGKKDWAGIAELHGEFLKKNASSPLAMYSAVQMAKMKVREGKGTEGASMLAEALRSRISDPASEQAEMLIAQLVQTIIPRKKPADIDVDALETEVVDILKKAVGDMETPTAAARIDYARALLNEKLKRGDKAKLIMKGIALSPAIKADDLSPGLLNACGELLLKEGGEDNLKRAEEMFQRLADRYKDSPYSDAGPVGLGRVLLARDKPQDALKVLNEALDTNPGMSSIVEAVLGKIQALVTLGSPAQLDEAEKSALEVIGDKSFRGEPAGRAYLALTQIYRKRASTVSGEAAADANKKAFGYSQRVYLTYKAFPEICAQGYWQSYEIAKDLGEATIAVETLRALATDPKVQKSPLAEKAKAELAAMGQPVEK